MPRPRGLRLLAAAASGLLLALAFPAFDLGALAWVALVPLLLALDGQPPAAAFRLGWAAGLVWFGILLGWARSFGFPAWVALTVLMACFPAVFAALCAWLPDGRRGRLLWTVPLAWAATELLRTTGPLAFPWGLLGLTQYRVPSMLALASVVGVVGVSALIVAVNAAVAVAVRARRPAGPTVAAAVLAATAIAAGVPAGSPAAPAGPRHRVVAAVQPNVDPRRPDAVATGRPAASLVCTVCGAPGSGSAGAAQVQAGLALEGAVRARAAGAQLVVLPETAIPADVGADVPLRRALARAAGGATVVVGATAPGPRNVAVVLGPGGEVLGVYAKRRLVPFGEAGVVPGDRSAPIATPVGALGVLICYESAFPAMSRRLARDGAEVLVVLTNDGWFGDAGGPAQHAAHAVFRAAETGRPVVRAANTGVSMLIRPDGRPVARQPLETAGVIAAALPWGGPPAPYVRWGWLWEPAALGAWLALGGRRAWPALRSRGTAVRGLVVALGGPGVVWVAGQWIGNTGGAAWVAAAFLLGAAWRAAPRAPFDARGFWVSLGSSLATTGALAAAMVVAYARYGFDVSVARPAPAAALLLVVQATAFETWLRGAVLDRAAALAGAPAAIAAAALAGALLHAGGPQELVLWHLLTGVLFGILRRYSGDAVGLGPARAAGDLVVLALTRLR